jgi:hypothetical protein
LTEGACRLDLEERQLVERTIADHCRVRVWTLYPVNCRSNHVHAVVFAQSRHPDDIREQFKAWCTQRLKEMEQQRHCTNAADPDTCATIRHHLWAERYAATRAGQHSGRRAPPDERRVRTGALCAIFLFPNQPNNLRDVHTPDT